MGLFGLPDIGKTIGGRGTIGTILDGLFGSLVDPGNITGMFGKNVGPGAFMDPNGTGGGIFPGQSWGSKGVTGINPGLPEVGPIANTAAEIYAGGELAGGFGGGTSSAGSGIGSSFGSSTPLDAGTGQITGNSFAGAPKSVDIPAGTTPYTTPSTGLPSWLSLSNANQGLQALSSVKNLAQPNQQQQPPRTLALPSNVPPAFSLAPPPMPQAGAPLPKVGGDSSSPDMSSLIQALLKMKGMGATA